jgi:DNA-binding PadR family transcriptional regulator
MTGYDIKQSMAKSTAYFYEASFGSIYPILKKLQEKGWTFLNESVEKGKLKKVYGITKLGQEVFLEWLLQPPTVDDKEMLVRLHFYSLLERNTVKQLIAQYIMENERVLKELDELEAEFKEVDLMDKATLYYGRDFYRFNIDWFRKYVKSLEQ